MGDRKLVNGKTRFIHSFIHAGRAVLRRLQGERHGRAGPGAGAAGPCEAHGGHAVVRRPLAGERWRDGTRENEPAERRDRQHTRVTR